jgi:hypothetical protein
MSGAMLMESLVFKILVGYWIAGVVSSIPLAFKGILNPKTLQSSSILGFVGRVLLFVLLMMLFWPLMAPILLSDQRRKAIQEVRSIYEHYRYHWTSEATKVERLLGIYNVFKRYRPQARPEKLLKAIARLYFEVMRWRESQANDALRIIESRIGSEIVNLNDLARAILVLKKPCLGCLPDFDYDEEFRAAREKDKMIEQILGGSTAQDAEVR